MSGSLILEIRLFFGKRGVTISLNSILLEQISTCQFAPRPFPQNDYLFMHIFNSNPDCKTLFPWIIKYETEGRDFTEGKEFRSQSLRFVQVSNERRGGGGKSNLDVGPQWNSLETIAHVVKNVYHMERLEGFLYDIGQRHIKYASRGFKPQYWDLFQVSLPLSSLSHTFC